MHSNWFFSACLTRFIPHSECGTGHFFLCIHRMQMSQRVYQQQWLTYGLWPRCINILPTYIYRHLHLRSVIYTFTFLHMCFFESGSHLHPFSTEEPHQVSAGECAFLCGCELHWYPHHTMDFHVRSGEPQHWDLAAGGVLQHNGGLQQQSAALRQRLHGPVRPAAAGCWILCGHCDRNGGKQ